MEVLAIPPRDNSVKVIQKAAELLGCFSLDQPEWGLVELSNCTGLHPATCHRLLKSLSKAGFIVQDGASHRYRLGFKLLELGSVVQAHLHLPREAFDVMRRLVEQCQESAYLACLSHDRVVYVAVVESPRSVRITARVGETRPLHATATGKVFLTFLPAEESAGILEGPLHAFTPLTITEKAQLQEQLADVRRRGYALTSDEYRHEVASVAAPIWDRAGQVVAALALSGPSFRLRPEAAVELAGPLLEATATISARLGYPPLRPRTSR